MQLFFRTALKLHLWLLLIIDTCQGYIDNSSFSEEIVQIIFFLISNIS